MSSVALLVCTLSRLEAAISPLRSHELSTIIATPLKVLSTLSALTARYLPTAEELKNYQVLQVSNVPPFKDASRLRDLLKPLFEPY
ncbi:hypothetical protein V1514DRAFT_323002, partial [Lipomyces japonicus]|uniref:uncharacterized protein n=1 Tax=Lipomyces japonicus TaxID=56871 RepID=UPI0034CD5153